MSERQPTGTQPQQSVQDASAERPHRAGYGPDYGYANGYSYGPGYGAMPPPGEVHLLDYVRTLYKRRWTALTAFLLVFLTVVVYTFTGTPIYQARLQILIEPDNPNVVSFKEVIEQDKSTTDYYQTQYRLLQSRLLARKTLDSLKLWDHPEIGGGQQARSFSLTGAILNAPSAVASLFQSKKKADPQLGETATQSRAIDRFLAHLTVAPIRNSRLVDVRFESVDPNLAARAANALGRNYIEQNLEFKFMASKEASDWLGGQLAEQRKKVENSELALQNYREKGEAVALEDRQNIVVQRLTDLNAALTRARTDRMEKETLYNRMAGLQNDPIQIDTFPAILGNAFVQQLKGQIADLQRQQAQLAEKFGEKHPEMLKVRTAIESTDAKLKAEIAKVVQSVKNDYLAAKDQESRLVAALDQQKVEALALNRQGIDYGYLRREADSNKQMYDSLMQRAKETGVSAEIRTSNIRIVDTAEVPRSPVRPNQQMNLLLALFSGALVGAGLAFMFEHLDSRIKSPDEIKGHLGLPFFGLVPLIKTSRDEHASPILNNGVPANFSEAFRGIRTNILFSSAETGSRSLVVSSTGPGEGKTLVASNIALSLAQAGQRVLLIDADMRRPRLHDIFAAQREPGLSNLMVGNARASEAIRKSSLPGLWLLPAGPNPPNPAELIGSQRFKDLLASVGQHFDWVVLDSPPVMAVTDAALLAHRATAVLFVVGCEMTSRHAAQAALEQLSVGKSKVLGAVLNRVNVERNSYYYAHYYRKDYANYYNDTTPQG